MRKFLLFFLIISTITVSAKQFTVSGYIYQKGSGETLVSAHCSETISGKSTISNVSGFYSLTLNVGVVYLKSGFIGYEEAFCSFNLEHDTLINFYLQEKSEYVGEIVISAETPLHEQTLLGKKILSIEQLKVIPSFIGETDIMKAIATIPGVSLGREGRSNIYVRGGDRGQNLILLDGAKLYNTNHIGGFFSLLNPNVIKQVDVYKGGFPSRYGGRASSVVDIYTRDGNREKVEGKFNIGLLSSGASVEGPIGKNLSFLVAARASYYDLYTIPARREIKIYGEGDYFTFQFYDVNAKLCYYINQRNKIFINFFSGNDLYKSIGISKSSSKNSIDSILYNIHNYCFTVGSYSSLAAKLFFKNTITISNYNNQLGITLFNNDKEIISTNRYKSMSKINELNMQSRIEYYASKAHSLKVGIEYSNYKFLPGQNYSYSTNSATGYSQDTSLGYFSNLYANEVNIYGEDDICFTQNLFLNIGLRGTAYFCEGRNYFKVEPRLSFRAKLSESFSLKANYTLMNQFNHVIVSNFGLFEKEMWIATTKNIPPQQAHQISVGLFSSSEELKLDFSAEVYYKRMKNLLEYKAQSDVDIVVTDLDEMVVKGGIGESYGAEFEAKYKNKNFSADFGYVLSWNNRRFDDLNNGEWYPFIYDRRHDFSCLMTYIISRHYSFSSNFVFSTGAPYTLPEGYVKEDDYMYGYYAYSGINNRRLPNYHRLDISLVKKEKTKRGNIQSFSLNIFNVYARQNPVMIYYDQNTGNVYQKSMFSMIPTISYSLEF
jgi:hypothetical protein